jgi:capsular polysaccharide biosynthesis protein
MTRIRSGLRRLVSAASGRADTQAPAVDRSAEAAASLRRELDDLQTQVAAMARLLASTQARLEQLADRQRQTLREAAALAALPAARLRSDLLRLEGSPSRRLGVRRHGVGRPVSLPVRPSIGVTACVTASPDVRELWERLLATEHACADDMLRGEAGTVLELTDAVIANGETVRLTLRASGPEPDAAARLELAAVPRFAYALPPRKQRNVGHWLLDAVPHVFALSRLAPGATFLLPQPTREVHWEALALAGVARDRVRIWAGAPVACRRLFVQETDGRVARGRPLPMLLDLRQHVISTIAPAPDRRGRRIYVSRRDAKPHRQWLSNHDEVEQVFRSRGFEILTLRSEPMAEQVRIFREARIVAGLSGAGLANMVFSDDGTHVVTIITNSLMQWYAEAQGSRSLWADGTLRPGSPINELSDSPRFYAHLAAACRQQCHTFVADDRVPVEPLGRFLDEVVARADAA